MLVAPAMTCSVQSPEFSPPFVVTWTVPVLPRQAMAISPSAEQSTSAQKFASPETGDQFVPLLVDTWIGKSRTARKIFCPFEDIAMPFGVIPVRV